jgi:hypothetical protein
MEFVLTPLASVGPFSLGAKRAQVRDAAKANGVDLRSEHGSSDYFAKDIAIQVEYDDRGCAWFIGANSTPGFRLLFSGVDLFDAPAAEVFELFCKSEGGPAPPFVDGGYTFCNQIVSLWKADEQYDYHSWVDARARAVWAQIGTGSLNYLSAIRKAG